MANREQLQSESVFPRRERAVAIANVLDVFEKTDPGLKGQIGHKYDVRVGYPPDCPQVTVAVSSAITPRTRDHFDYYSRLTGIDFGLVSVDDLDGQHIGSLAVPFINTQAVEQRLAGHGMEVWGIPGIVVDNLKNKATSHRLGEEFGLERFQPAEHRIFHIRDFQVETLKYVADIRQGYQDAQMSNYPIGVVARAQQSDGNYGGCYIREEDGKPTFRKNGTDNTRESFESWPEALAHAYQYLKSTGNSREDIAPEVVVSRLMDLETSPGLAVFILEGQVFPLGWNGQVQEKGNTACTGTSTFMPQSEYQRWLQERYEPETEEEFERFLRLSFIKYGVNINSVRGTCNVDLMFPGPLERIYQARIDSNIPYWYAEFNPRFTNSTDAVMHILAVQNRTRSVNNMRRVFEEGFYTQDHYQFKPGTDLDQARDRIEALDQKLRSQGTRILVRMYEDDDLSMALAFAGNIAQAKRELDNITATF